MTLNQLRIEQAKSAALLKALARLVCTSDDGFEIAIIEGVDITEDLEGVDLDELRAAIQQRHLDYEL